MAGFTLLEALIALVVLSVGLLGLAALQTTALRNNHNAYLRGQATMLAYDIIDRMRVNRVAANAGSYTLAINATPSASSTDCNSTSASCSTSQLAQFDLSDWMGRVTAALPAGDGGITAPAATAARPVYTVTMQWNDCRGATSCQAQQVVVSTEL